MAWRTSVPRDPLSEREPLGLEHHPRLLGIVVFNKDQLRLAEDSTWTVFWRADLPDFDHTDPGSMIAVQQSRLCHSDIALD